MSEEKWLEEKFLKNTKGFEFRIRENATTFTILFANDTYSNKTYLVK